MDFGHVPVLLNEVLNLLQLKPGNIVIDATVGGAGHASEIIKLINPGGFLIGIDRDPEALHAAEERLIENSGSFELMHGDFSAMRLFAESIDVRSVDAILMDLGVSSHQINDPTRGFSFRYNGNLDMRMDPDQKISAYDVINNYTVEDLERIISKYGEERWAKRIALFIVNNRPIKTTGELEQTIKNAVPKRARVGSDHPARRTFQAIRIEVNREIEILPNALISAIDLLKPGGRLCVISFHSLEDRIVKQTFKQLSGQCICPDSSQVCKCAEQARIRILTRKPLVPSIEEASSNPRSKSSKLRACQKL